MSDPLMRRNGSGACPPGGPCPPMLVQDTRNGRAGFQTSMLPPQQVPGSTVVFDPCDPERGNLHKWAGFNGAAELSEESAGSNVPALFQPIAQNQVGSAQWTTVASYVIPAGLIGVALLFEAQSNVMQSFSDAIDWAVFVNNSPVGDSGGPWNGAVNWPTDVPINQNARPGTTLRIVARVQNAFWTTGATPIRSLIVGRAFARIYLVGIQPPCPQNGIGGERLR